MRRPFLLLAVSCVLVAAACAGGRQHARWLGLDTAQYHLRTGMVFLERGMAEDARRELALAADLDPGCGQAWCALTVAFALEGRWVEARECLSKARWLARYDIARCQTKVAEMRLLLAERPDGWLDAARDLYAKAAPLCPEDKAPAYYMALCYKRALRLGKAQELLREVAVAGAAHSREAAAEWRLVCRALRCTPRTDLGCELAPQASISRAELAALLVAELGLGGEAASGQGCTQVPSDLVGHRLREQVLPVLLLDLEPLRAFGDGTFHPDTQVSRAEFAQAVEALLVAWSHGGLKWRAPPTSPYPDVPRDTPGYEALTLCASRGLLEVRDLITGRLDPGSPISGADALLAIGRLREQLGAR